MRGIRRFSSVALAAAAVAAATAAAAPARSSECEALTRTRPLNRCYGALPPVRAFVRLTGRNGSSEHGTATIKFGLHETVVVLTLRGAPQGVERVALLRPGGCWGRTISLGLGGVGAGTRRIRTDPAPRIEPMSLVVRTAAPAAAGRVVACGRVRIG